MANRRAFIVGMLATGLLPKATWADVGSPAFFSAGLTHDGTYVLCGLTASGQIAFTLPLPARGHAAAAHPKLAQAVAFARRPGTFAIVLDCASGTELARLNAPAGRHFYGHGTYSADGDLLFTTENDFDAGKGVIGVWNTRDHYARIGEFSSGGIGPHDIKLLPDGQTLVVANGGIETHPESGRTKLNLPTMRSNLSYLSLDRHILGQVELSNEYQRNSIRHLAVSQDATVAFAMQWQGDLTDQVPLLGTHRLADDRPPKLADADIFHNLQGYVGSVAANLQTIAITAPRGGALLEFSAQDLRLIDRLDLADVSGVATLQSGFICTSGNGHVGPSNGHGFGNPYAIKWDNHLVAV